MTQSQEVLGLYREGKYREITFFMHELTIYKKNNQEFEDIMLPIFNEAVSKENTKFLQFAINSRSMELDFDMWKVFYKALIEKGNSKYIRDLFDQNILGYTNLERLYLSIENKVNMNNKWFVKVLDLVTQMDYTSITTENCYKLMILLGDNKYTILFTYLLRLNGNIFSSEQIKDLSKSIKGFTGIYIYFDQFCTEQKDIPSIIKLAGNKKLVCETVVKSNRHRIDYMNSRRYKGTCNHYTNIKNLMPQGRSKGVTDSIENLAVSYLLQTKNSINNPNNVVETNKNSFCQDEVLKSSSVINTRTNIQNNTRDNIRNVFDEKSNSQKSGQLKKVPENNTIYKFGTDNISNLDEISYVINPKTSRRIQIGGSAYFKLIHEGYRLIGEVLLK